MEAYFRSKTYWRHIFIRRLTGDLTLIFAWRLTGDLTLIFARRLTRHLTLIFARRQTGDLTLIFARRQTGDLKLIFVWKGSLDTCDLLREDAIYHEAKNLSWNISSAQLLGTQKTTWKKRRKKRLEKTTWNGRSSGQSVPVNGTFKSVSCSFGYIIFGEFVPLGITADKSFWEKKNECIINLILYYIFIYIIK